MLYHAPWWLPGGNLQTIWPALFARRVLGERPRYRRERWSSPDQDFIDVDWIDQADSDTLMVLFHGLEGNSLSHYSQAFANFSREKGFKFAIPHFRGCSGEINLAARAYQSGDYEEIDWILKRFRQRHTGRIWAVGVSLGGNALLRWVAEMGQAASQVCDAVASVCAPLDLAASGRAIDSGFNRHVYARRFLDSMKPKALQKLDQHPGLFDRSALLAARNLYEFDNAFTAPLHGFKNTDDYWARASAKPHMQRIRVPALVLNARNDPFVPAASLPQQSEVSDSVTLWQPRHGGHVGFTRGRVPGHVRGLPDLVGGWLAAQKQSKSHGRSG